MAGFCEIKLAEPLDNSLLGEHLPSRRIFVDFTKEPFLEVRLSVLYGRSDQDFKRIKRSKSRSALYNSIDYHPNYYEPDLITTSKANYDSLDTHRDNILPFRNIKVRIIKSYRLLIHHKITQDLLVILEKLTAQMEQYILMVRSPMFLTI